MRKRLAGMGLVCAAVLAQGAVARWDGETLEALRPPEPEAEAAAVEPGLDSLRSPAPGVEPPMPYGLPAPTPEEIAARKAELVERIAARKAEPEVPKREGLAAVLERREMRRLEKRETGRRVVAGKLLRTWDDGSETVEELKRLTVRREVAEAVTLARAKAETLERVAAAGRARLKDGESASEAELLALGTETSGSGGAAAGGALAGVLAGLAAGKLKPKRKG